MKKNRIILVTGLIIIAFMGPRPVEALEKYVIYSYNSVTNHAGAWDIYNNEAIENGTWWSKDLLIEFKYYSIRQDGYKYKIRVDYDGHSELFPEFMSITYKWGSGNEVWIAECSYFTWDSKIQIANASSSTLHIYFSDTSSLDSIADIWYFGFEPKLYVYF
jgi:hypothetical protein